MPRVAFHVTALLLTVPDTVAENCCVPPVPTEVLVGETLMELTTGGVIVTVEEADLVLFWLLVAVTVSVPDRIGAVYKPADVTVPLTAFQLTDLSLTVPVIVAVNCIVCPASAEAGDGEMLTDVTTGGVMVTIEDANLVLSALLVAVTVSVPERIGAVYRPAEVMVPLAAFHVTDLSVTVPATVAVNCMVVLTGIEDAAGEIAIDCRLFAALVTLRVADPCMPPDCAVIVTLPAEVPEASPALLTEAILESDEPHCADAVTSWVELSE